MARRLALVLVCGLVLAAPAAGDNSGKIGGKDVDNQQIRFTRVWVKHNGQWRSAAFQQTAVAK